MKPRCLPRLVLVAAVLLATSGALALPDRTPLELLKAREWLNRDAEGEVYLGKVMALLYEAYAAEADEAYHPYLLELTDVLKTPLRSSYRLVLKGYTDTSGDREANTALSRKRAKRLKQTLVKDYYFDGERISVEGCGPEDPVASNDTDWGRSRNRRVEIHVYGDVSQAVRFVTPEENTP